MQSGGWSITVSVTMLSEKTKKELERRRSSLYADLYQLCGQMTVHSLENLCRKIHAIEWKIYSFKKDGRI